LPTKEQVNQIMIMKNNILGLIFVLAATSSLQGAPPRVPMDFSGTPGSSPVSVSFSSDVDFTITGSAVTGNFILFTIENLFPSNTGQQHFITSFSSNLQYDINGGSLQNVAGWCDDGYTSGDVTGNDGYFWFTTGQNLNPGDVITLHAGALASSGNAAANFNLGTSGSYAMFIANASSGYGGADISGFGVIEPVPEPATLALAGLGALGCVLMFWRRKS
jgi:hypothetical protein